MQGIGRQIQSQWLHLDLLTDNIGQSQAIRTSMETFAFGEPPPPSPAGYYSMFAFWMGGAGTYIDSGLTFKPFWALQATRIQGGIFNGA